MRHTDTSRPRGPRRLVLGLGSLLTAAVLPLAAPAPAPAAGAAADCTSEASPLPLVPGCDDTDPPATRIDSASPAPNAAGYLRATEVTIRFSGSYDDTDSDPIGFECQLFDTATAPASWTDCSSGSVTYTGLEEGTATPYTFRVRAVDTADDAIDLANPVLGGTDEPDHDATPAQLVLRADATPPNTYGFLRTGYYDEDHPDDPMVTSTRVQLRLQSTEGGGDVPARFRCRLDDRAVACRDGRATLTGPAAGRHRFTAAAVDPAGNVDPTPFSQAFFMPRNLTTADADRASSGAWRRVGSPGAFAGDRLESTRYGAGLSFRVRNVRQVALLAPAGPGLGTVQLRVGSGPWHSVRLAATTASRLEVYPVRSALQGRVSGILALRVASHGKPVRVDAVVAR